jgi:hypothetical protein
MRTKQILACEAKRLQNFKFLPYVFKKVGVGLMILSIIGIIFFTEVYGDMPVVKTIGRHLILLGMLLISISREKLEDEYIIQLRAQSYTWAFIFGVLYAIVQPYINFSVKTIFKPGEAAFADMEVFIILWFMLAIQIMFFYVLKLAR